MENVTRLISCIVTALGCNMEPAALIAKAVALIKTFKPAIQTVDVHIYEQLGPDVGKVRLPVWTRMLQTVAGPSSGLNGSACCTGQTAAMLFSLQHRRCF